MLKAIVLPGLDGTGALLDDFAECLARDFDVEVVAYPGDEPLGYPALRELVRERLPDDGFILIAESFSGPIALELASEHPAGLRALVMCASFARVDLPGKGWLSAFVRRMPLKLAPVPLLSALLWGAWRTSDRTRALRRALSQVADRAVRTRALAALSVDATRGASPAVPLLYLQAARDRLIGPAHARALRARFPDMQLQSFDAPHFLLQVRPGECARAIAAFVAGA